MVPLSLMTMEKPEPLNNAEKKELRGMAQRLKPQVRIGKQGLTDAVFSEIETALASKGLVKIRFDGDREAIRQYCADIPTKTQSEYVGGVGRIGIFFREMSE
ncbi:MAG: YhbY family RNA-binding protein [Coraliomargaritaceae bacterium]